MGEKRISEVGMYSMFENIPTCNKLYYACYASNTIWSLLLEKTKGNLKCPTSGEIETFIFPTLGRDISYKTPHNAMNY